MGRGSERWEGEGKGREGAEGGEKIGKGGLDLDIWPQVPRYATGYYCQMFAEAYSEHMN